MPDQLAQHDAEGDRRDQRHHGGRVSKALDHEEVERHPEQAGRGDRRNRREHEGARRGGTAERGTEPLHHRKRQEGRDERHVRVGEVDDVEHAEQQAEADGDQGVDRPERHEIEKLLRDLLGHTRFVSEAAGFGRGSPLTRSTELDEADHA